MPAFDCPHCGYSTPTAAPFCAHCGTNLADGLLPTAPAEESPEEPASAPSDRTADTTAAAAQTGEPQPAPEPEERASPRMWPPPAPAERDDAPDAPQDAAAPAVVAPPERLMADVKGLLEPADPVEFAASATGASEWPGGVPQLPPALTVSEEERRQLRELFASELPLAATAAPDRSPGADPSTGRALQRRHWPEWLLLLGLTVAMLWGPPTPSGEARPHPWPGVLEAYQRIESLPPNSLVLVNWAYDPATAGEMDLVAQPVIEHLLHKQAKLIVVSQLPGGPATARRLIAKAAESALWPARSQVLVNDIIEGGYLPGGAASLPLLGVAPAESLPIDPGWVKLKERFTVAGLGNEGPALNLLVAARVEDVRRWLEQVQPLNNGTVIAVTGAAIDPALRPYWHSGQLAGLVSGWDGGAAYQRRSGRSQSLPEQARSLRQISGQNWGFGILIVVVVLGNLAGFTERRLA